MHLDDGDALRGHDLGGGQPGAVVVPHGLDEVIDERLRVRVVELGGRQAG